MVPGLVLASYKQQAIRQPGIKPVNFYGSWDTISRSMLTFLNVAAAPVFHAFKELSSFKVKLHRSNLPADRVVEMAGKLMLHIVNQFVVGYTAMVPHCVKNCSAARIVLCGVNRRTLL
jgi:hypothetical protein